MPNPRRNSYSGGQSTENPFHQNHSIISSLEQFLKRPQAIPLLLSIFVFLTWASLNLQRSSHNQLPNNAQQRKEEISSAEDDEKVNLVRFKSGFPSPIATDKRGWLLNPVSLALDSGIKGGAVSCASVHIGEMQPGAMRGNHRHHDCNETFVIWGAKTKFRLENNQIAGKGYAEAIIDAEEVAVVASPSGTAHALMNIDPVRTTYFIGCQDKLINYNGSSSTTNFNVWNDL
ncbi:hypothetical protein HS088_TW13G00478 [Tripterygium wilfordii]|uniref:Capsular polysaccharide assembling protein CapF C-terminal domain-containing protein n=1 Tax=Tripterygium wilfordii TaxID=458696 RepID=A0A7J7CU34_TRIWF|nr:uncharacterized protein LOC120012134 [Tripterygium wilfordii]KAF5737593.1 hypothetical protein HS088_TW13G00478 [Tripterygium wilfordii]